MNEGRQPAHLRFALSRPGRDTVSGMNPVEISLALVVRQERLLLQRRDPAAAVLPGRWEFPGGKVEAGESPLVALQRELREEMGLECLRVEAFDPIAFAYPDRSVRLHPFGVETLGWPCTALAWGWFRPAETLRLSCPEANDLLMPLVARLCGSRM